MVKIANYLDYIKNIDSVQEFLKNASITEKIFRSKLRALDKFIPFLMNRFKANYQELKEFNLNDYNAMNIKETNKFKQKLEKTGIYTKLIDGTWLNLKANTKSQLFMKYVDNCVKNEQKKPIEKRTNRNSFLNYAWSIQGFFGLLGYEYLGNPKNMEKIKSNGFHLSEDITYEDVIELYEKLDNSKYKLILKIIMYCGLNPADVVLLTPKDFEKYDDGTYYVLVKAREKTKRKDTQYLITFHKNFLNEIKDYFERKVHVNVKTKDAKGNAINQKKVSNLKKDGFYIIKEYENLIKLERSFKWNDKKDKNMRIFNSSASSVIQAFKDNVEKNNINSEVMSSSIRRLCFTMIKSIFSLTDKDIFNLWTQHKEGLITRNYIIDLMDRIIENEYVEKISEKVLIGSVKDYIREVKDYKNGMNRVGKLEGIIGKLYKVFSGVFEQAKEDMDIDSEYFGMISELEDEIKKLGK